MKYPNLVDGASTNMSVIAPASSITARGTDCGGLKTRDAATATPASASSATTTVCPVCGQVDAMMCPGSGLDAADRTWASPSGNSIVFTSRDLGWSMMNGPTHAATTASAVSVKEATARLPSRTASKATATKSAG